MNATEDEKHVILYCNKYSERINLLKNMTDIFPIFNSLSNDEKLIFLMKCEDIEIFHLLSNFLEHVLKVRGEL